MKRILVVGSSGLVGSRFTDLLAKDIQPLLPKSKELDITSLSSVKDFFRQNEGDFDVVVNFAAFTDVDRAEKQKSDEAGDVWQINVAGAQNLADAAKKYSKFLIHISTDFVFPGTKDYPGPYSEDAKLPEELDNLSWYGWTKLVGEKKVIEASEKFAIVRIAYPYRAHYTRKVDFARKILHLFDEGRLYPMFTDQKFTPTFIDEACSAIEKLAEFKKGGIYHVVSSDITTPYDFASYLLEKVRGAKGVVKKGLLKDFLKTQARTPRPRLGGLKSKKSQKKLGMKFMPWKQAVDKFVEQFRKG